ncbi:MAG: hypothetical protein AAF264_04895 [Pseudomonadota bacterium]
MTEAAKPAARLDRADDDRIKGRTDGLPWTTGDQRGALELERDSSQHRRHHSLFEDLLN